MQILIVVSIFCLLLSFAFDRRKTYQGIVRGTKMFMGLLPSLLTVLILISVFLYLIPDQMIAQLLGAKSGAVGIMIAATVGSISLIPGFIAFPMARIFLAKGVSYSVVAVFLTNLIMVGILTLPIEFRYFGRKAAIMRNVLSFFGAIVIGLLIGMFY